MFDNTKLLAEAQRLISEIDREEPKFPEGSIERRFFAKMRSVNALNQEALTLGQRINPLDPAQKDQVQHLVDVNLEAQKVMGEALAILQETDAAYDRALVARVMGWKPLP